MRDLESIEAHIAHIQNDINGIRSKPHMEASLRLFIQKRLQSTQVVCSAPEPLGKVSASGAVGRVGGILTLGYGFFGGNHTFGMRNSVLRVPKDVPAAARLSRPLVRDGSRQAPADWESGSATYVLYA